MNPAKRICLRPVRSLLQTTNQTYRPAVRQYSLLSSKCSPRRCAPLPKQSAPLFRRNETSASVAASPSSTTEQQPERRPWRAAPHRRPDQPVYELYFTCKVCKERSGHSISKQAYHHGTTLVQCPGCKNRHLITDHLKIFSDKSVTIEDILREKGEVLKTGGLDAEGEIEFWDTLDVEAAEKASAQEMEKES